MNTNILGAFRAYLFDKCVGCAQFGHHFLIIGMGSILMLPTLLGATTNLNSFDVLSDFYKVSDQEVSAYLQKEDLRQAIRVKLSPYRITAFSSKNDSLHKINILQNARKIVCELVQDQLNQEKLKANSDPTKLNSLQEALKNCHKQLAFDLKESALLEANKEKKIQQRESVELALLFLSKNPEEVGVLTSKIIDSNGEINTKALTEQINAASSSFHSKDLSVLVEEMNQAQNVGWITLIENTDFEQQNPEFSKKILTSSQAPPKSEDENNKNQFSTPTPNFTNELAELSINGQEQDSTYLTESIFDAFPPPQKNKGGSLQTKASPLQTGTKYKKRAKKMTEAKKSHSQANIGRTPGNKVPSKKTASHQKTPQAKQPHSGEKLSSNERKIVEDARTEENINETPLPSEEEAGPEALTESNTRQEDKTKAEGLQEIKNQNSEELLAQKENSQTSKSEVSNTSSTEAEELGFSGASLLDVKANHQKDNYKNPKTALSTWNNQLGINENGDKTNFAVSSSGLVYDMRNSKADASGNIFSRGTTLPAPHLNIEDTRLKIQNELNQKNLSESKRKSHLADLVMLQSLAQQQVNMNPISPNKTSRNISSSGAKSKIISEKYSKALLKNLSNNSRANNPLPTTPSQEELNYLTSTPSSVPESVPAQSSFKENSSEPSNDCQRITKNLDKFLRFALNEDNTSKADHFYVTPHKDGSFGSKLCSYLDKLSIDLMKGNYSLEDDFYFAEQDPFQWYFLTEAHKKTFQFKDYQKLHQCLGGMSETLDIVMGNYHKIHGLSDEEELSMYRQEGQLIYELQTVSQFFDQANPNAVGKNWQSAPMRSEHSGYMCTLLQKKEHLLAFQAESTPEKRKELVTKAQKSPPETSLKCQRLQAYFEEAKNSLHGLSKEETSQACSNLDRYAILRMQNTHVNQGILSSYETNSSLPKASLKELTELRFCLQEDNTWIQAMNKRPENISDIEQFKKDHRKKYRDYHYRIIQETTALFSNLSHEQSPSSNPIIDADTNFICKALFDENETQRNLISEETILLTNSHSFLKTTPKKY